jgi:hypothetical protein
MVTCHSLLVTCHSLLVTCHSLLVLQALAAMLDGLAQDVRASGLPTDGYAAQALQGLLFQVTAPWVWPPRAWAAHVVVNLRWLGYRLAKLKAGSCGGWGLGGPLWL